MKLSLMHRNALTMTLEYDSQLHGFTKITSRENLEHAPAASFDAMGHVTIENLNSWWAGRAIPRTRDGFRRLSDALSIKAPEQLLEVSHALSLSDTYWVQRSDEDLAWENINYFDNAFDGELGLYTLGESSSKQRSLPQANPSSSASGDLQKAWIIDEDGGRTLLKAGRGLAAQEVYNELAATRLYESVMPKGAFVPYRIARRGGRVYSACPDMLDGNSDLVTAADLLLNRKHRGSISDYEWCISGLEESGIRDAELSLCRMLACDFALGNFDRHYNNFGVIRDAETLEFARFAPVYDSGNSLWCDKAFLDRPLDYSYDPLPFGRRTSPLQDPDPTAQLDMLGDWRWFEKGMFDVAPDIVHETLAQDENIAAERIAKVVDAVARNVRTLETIAAKAPTYRGTCSNRMRAAGKRVDPLPCMIREEA